MLTSGPSSPDRQCGQHGRSDIARKTISSSRWAHTTAASLSRLRSLGVSIAAVQNQTVFASSFFPSVHQAAPTRYGVSWYGVEGASKMDRTYHAEALRCHIVNAKGCDFCR